MTQHITQITDYDNAGGEDRGPGWRVEVQDDNENHTVKVEATESILNDPKLGAESKSAIQSRGRSAVQPYLNRGVRLPTLIIIHANKLEPIYQ